jgi:hypothetical protein
MRGASLATALRQLGQDESAPTSADGSSVEVFESGTSLARPRPSDLADTVPPHRLVANTALALAPDAGSEDDEDAPPALRPDQLAAWLERRG